ncbi:MAG: leucine-rich repeat protein [Clostridia bacterium]|nr:leucine-rich repeat protein [Clostridia bacterium]
MIQKKTANGRSINGKRIGGAMILLTLVFLAVFLLSGCDVTIEEGEIRIPVMLSDADGLTVTSENPVYVPIGGDAVFTVEAEDGVVIDNLPEDAVYADGTLKLPGVLFPKTLKLNTHRLTLCDFFADVGIFGTGTLEATHTQGTYWSETEITLNAIPEEGFYFTGYSIDKPADLGGEIVALEPSYSFVLSENVKLYANFAQSWIDPATTVKVPKDKWVLIYHANGGVLSETGEDGTKTVEFSNTYYHCPNTIQDWDFFEREGYLLYGYNTKADGTGTYYAPGWNVVMPERGAISLFCMWAKISDPKDFEYRVADGIAIVTKYKGTDEFVVIPETIDGYRVEGIMSRTFDVNTTMRKVMIGKSVRTVYDKAFNACSALEELYFSDSVTTITDAAFSNCGSLHKLYMMAVVTPHYGKSRNGTYAIKYERLITAPGKKLVIASGSNSAYGINSSLLENNLERGGHKYSVVNYGQNAGTALTFYNEVIAYHINEGDILVLAPEVNKFQFGYSEINTTLWQIFEGAYDAFACVDIRQYTHIFTSFTTFNKARNQTKQNLAAYEIYTTDTVNSYGDYSLQKTGYSKDYANTVKSLLDKGGVGGTNYASCTSHMNNYADKLNRTLDLVAAKGGTVLISFAATNIISLKAESQIAGGEVQRAYEEMVDKTLHGTRISVVSTYSMETDLFFNSHNHLGTAGAAIRTGYISDDILAYLNKAE